MIDDTWYFRGKLMENCYPLFDGEYRWHKIQNCPKCQAKKSIKPCIWGMPSAEDLQITKTECKLNLSKESLDYRFKLFSE